MASPGSLLDLMTIQFYMTHEHHYSMQDTNDMTPVEMNVNVAFILKHLDDLKKARQQQG